MLGLGCRYVASLQRFIRVIEQLCHEREQSKSGRFFVGDGRSGIGAVWPVRPNLFIFNSSNLIGHIR